MLNILAAIIVILAYTICGLWLLNRKWKSESDLDLGFFIAIIFVAIATWFALYLAGA